MEAGPLQAQILYMVPAAAGFQARGCMKSQTDGDEGLL